MTRIRVGITAVFAVAVLAGLAGCGVLFGGSYEFSAEPIAGFGVGEWTFGSGYVEPGFDPGEWEVDLYPVTPNVGFEPWESGAYDTQDNRIFFTAPSTLEPRQLRLALLGDDSDRQTITYYDGETNFIFTEGWIHLLVDEVAGTAELKMDVTYDEKWFNGTVTIPIAP